MSQEPDDADFPGARLGLPETGPGAAAGWGRRVGALAIDWLLSLLVASAFLGSDVFGGGGAAERWAPLAVFAVEVWILTSLLGGSAGQVVAKVVVRRTSGRLLDPGRVLLRTLLICLVIPPVVYNRDQRGLHDIATDSMVLRR